MLNGRRVDVRHSELALGAIGVEASKKMVSIDFYGNYNYSISGIIGSIHLPRLKTHGLPLTKYVKIMYI